MRRGKRNETLKSDTTRRPARMNAQWLGPAPREVIPTCPSLAFVSLGQIPDDLCSPQTPQLIDQPPCDYGLSIAQGTGPKTARRQLVWHLSVPWQQPTTMSDFLCVSMYCRQVLLCDGVHRNALYLIASYSRGLALPCLALRGRWRLSWSWRLGSRPPHTPPVQVPYQLIMDALWSRLSDAIFAWGTICFPAPVFFFILAF